MNIFDYELFRKSSGEKGEILKTPTGYLVKKYRDFCIMYYAKRYKVYRNAFNDLRTDGFCKN